MVPDDGRRVEAELPAALLETPAYVDVVPSGAKLRVEATYRLQMLPAVRHIAAWDVLRLTIVQEDMYRTTRCIGHALGDRPVARWGDVGAPNPYVVGAHE